MRFWAVYNVLIGDGDDEDGSGKKKKSLGVEEPK